MNMIATAERVDATSKEISSPGIRFNEIQVLTRSFTLHGLHRDAHRIMGTDSVRDGWIFGWEDHRGLRNVVIRTAEPHAGLPARNLALEAGTPAPFTLAVRAGRRQPLDPDQMKEWLRSKLVGMTTSIEAMHMQACPLGKRDSPIRNVFFWRIEGVLEIVDPIAAEAVMRKGVGRMRGFGLGMLQFP